MSTMEILRRFKDADCSIQLDDGRVLQARGLQRLAEKWAAATAGDQWAEMSAAAQSLAVSDALAGLIEQIPTDD